MSQNIPAKLFQNCFSILLGFLAITPAVGQGITTPTTLPPTAKDATVTIIRTDVKWIELTAVSASLKPLVFKISSPPAHGTFLEGDDPKEVPGQPSKARILYKPPTDRSIQEDSFEFKAKREPGLFSQAAKIHIRIIDPEPKLIIPETVNFGRIAVGSPKTAILTIRNEGTADFRQQIVSPAPFKIIQGRNPVELAPGQETRLVFLFDPARAGNYNKPLPLQPNASGRDLRLIGSAYSSVELDPLMMQLQWDGQTKSRQSVLKLKNVELFPLLAQIKVSEPLQAPAGVEVPGGAEVGIPISIPLSHLDHVQSQVYVSVGQDHQVVQVEAKPVPALLELLSPVNGLSFDAMQNEVIEPRLVTVRNIGGETAFVFGQTGMPFSLAEGMESQEIPPGGTCSFRVQLDTSAPRETKKTLELIGAAAVVSIPLAAKISLDESAIAIPEELGEGARPKHGQGALVTRVLKSENDDGTTTAIGPGPGAIGPSIDLAIESLRRQNGDAVAKKMEFAIAQSQADQLEEAERQVREFLGAPPVEDQFSRKVPPVTDVYLKEARPHSLKLWWKHPGGEKKHYVVDTEVRMKTKDGMPYPEWYRFSQPENLDIVDDGTGQGVIATIKGLQPNHLFTIRVLAIANGEYSRPHRYFRFATAPPPAPWFHWWQLPVLVLLGIGGLKLYQRKKQNG